MQVNVTGSKELDLYKTRGIWQLLWDTGYLSSQDETRPEVNVHVGRKMIHKSDDSK